MPERPVHQRDAAATRSRRRRLRPASRSATAHEYPAMKAPSKQRPVSQDTEPVGIVISRGRESEPTPVFSAYMYAPDPDAHAPSARVLVGA